SYLSLLFLSIAVNFTAGAALQEEGRSLAHKKKLLIFAIAANLLMLGYFKYVDFFIYHVNFFFNMDVLAKNILLPLGISFYTITQIAYLIDSYEGVVKEQNMLTYSVFVTFFPHLLIGPIIHHKQMIPQFESMRAKLPSYKNLSLGVFLFAIGLFKKGVIADELKPYADIVYDTLSHPSFFESWIGSTAYTLQLYFDFSGYSDMAVGSAMLFNIKLPINFNSPYKAKGLIEFWQRWHMSFTIFIFTYIYAPILRSMKKITFSGAIFAMTVTLIIAGVWHGAAFGFMLFYLIHSGGLVVNHMWRKYKVFTLPSHLAWLLTFNVIIVSLVPFRAVTLIDTIKVYKGMLGLNGIVFPKIAQLDSIYDYFRVEHSGRLSFSGVEVMHYMLIFPILVFTILFIKNSNELAEKMKFNLTNCLFTTLTLIYALLHGKHVSEFLYFQF
ncbi:MAG: MBOAT family protein, partial [Nitrospinae bacterium]|nr:MBOAT family protein [Nitrospinota bacterium]